MRFRSGLYKIRRLRHDVMQQTISAVMPCHATDTNVAGVDTRVNRVILIVKAISKRWLRLIKYVITAFLKIHKRNVNAVLQERMFLNYYISRTRVIVWLLQTSVFVHYD